MKKLVALLAAIGLLSASAAAFATPITGTSTGTLTAGNGTTQINPYQTSWTGPGNNTSTLTAGTSAGTDSINQNYAVVGGLNVKLASLTWVDQDNLKDVTNGATWNVAVTLTDPSLSTSLPADFLTIKLKNGSKPDTISLGSLAGLSGTFGTWQIGNFHYEATGGTSLNGLDWISSQYSTGSLWLEADFTNTAPEVINTASVPVPEPGMMVLLSAGFAGLAIYGKGRKTV
ncbi:PEP-CTERM sorting domain-containing protein [Geomesophilobacter sediminis]|uniref:PEP-CTERM sorting domain-containing protein n=1 Tax=Geomesophilobacter sediminis TaxID=2798584 RepID=A0A8J7JI77_9BACT|nr:PEP-CTERM sorting domain-containing protein [Geomesophilobacter sediminis]MBJ6724155.1 PEP-CTERM sorting domain-containing protein [Geomesophilobacter sediminis]